MWFTTVLLFGSFLAFSNSSADLSGLDIGEGVVEKRGVMPHQSRAANGLRVSSTLFFVKLSGLSQLLAVYYPGQEYRFLLNSIQVGDTLKIWYRHSSDQDVPNLNTYQITKRNQIVLNQEEYRGKETLAGYIALAGAVVTVWLGIRQDRKYRKNRQN
ncbi:hypothetical protein HMJ29_02795 [Hymenobacter taeanensis]|uniref:DUF3592 domain-containing protein n=1 Tax=Hymenobacter taeanensis TaxID=2735321 RepID=A0A6M6BBZ5_9BACT|nr:MULTISPECIES: hypothetical protein [Hymenobacter]QJX45921.1 hypothetical protein HMJ29_02795 [Hymenobacter taeanensis]UOQ79767.1 hypothetical protein MUN83_13030 [Hymenobacter sp. 5414T-23]